MKPALALAASLLLLSPACGGGSYEVSLVHDGEALFSCDKATARDLSPDGGGYKYVCEAGADAGKQLYVVFDTSDNKDGTVKQLSIEGDASRVLLPAVRAGDSGVECESAAALGRATGEPPIAVGGSGTLEMAQPCGTVTLRVGAAD